jgi:hypothetical protein
MMLIYNSKNLFKPYFKNISIIFIWFFLSGCCCQKTIYIFKPPVNKIGVIEKPATTPHPAQFYLCGNAQYPCSAMNDRNYMHSHHPFSFHQQHKGKAYEKSRVKQTCHI